MAQDLRHQRACGLQSGTPVGTVDDRWRLHHQYRLGAIEETHAQHPALRRDQGALANLTIGLAGVLAEKNIRVNAVLPGPIWTPFIPSGMDEESVENFGGQTPMGRPGQPVELASAYVMLAADTASYTSGTLLTISGGAVTL